MASNGERPVVPRSMTFNGEGLVARSLWPSMVKGRWPKACCLQWRRNSGPRPVTSNGEEPEVSRSMTSNGEGSIARGLWPPTVK